MNAIDTSVLIHAYDMRDLQRKAVATQLVLSLEDGVLFWQVACEFIAASRRLLGTGFTPEDAWRRLFETTALLPLVLPTTQVLDRAHPLSRDRQFQFWDAMIFAACLEAGVTTLYSNDLPGAAIEGLRIIDPFA